MMKSKSMALFDLLGTKNKRFCVPEVQRDYTWNTEILDRLWKDLTNYTNVTDKNIVPNYFVGSLILYTLKEQDEILQIMDGQQRLTTFTVMFAALRARLRQLIIQKDLGNQDLSKVNEVIRNIDEKVLWHSFDPDQLNLEPKDNETKEFVFQVADFGTEDPSNYPTEFSSVSARNLSIAFGVFWGHLSSWGARDIIEFFKCLVSRVFVTVTYTRDISVAFQMFVSVNQGGTPLNAFDLFRGLIMTKAHVLGFQSMIRADVQDLTSAVRKSTGADGDGAESLINGVMRKWASARYGVVVKERDVPGRLDKEIRTIDDIGSLREIVRQACSFFLAFEQLNNISDILQEVKNKAGIWPPGVLQSRRVRGLAGQSFLKQQHSILLISMYSRRHLSGANPYSAEDIHSVMDYIEWLEFRLAIQPSNILEQFYPKIANKALNISKIATWWDQMVELGNDRHNSFQSGFAIFKEGPVKENVAVAFLSKIHDSNKDPGPSTRLYSCGAVQLAPITSPKPWKLRDDDIHKVTGYLGNWFLIDYRQKKTILSWGIEPESRWESLHEAAEKNATREELEAIKENKSGKGGTEHKPIEDYWGKSRIQKRTRRLINKLEGAYPNQFKKKKMSSGHSQ